MKWLIIIVILLILGCNQQSEQLSIGEIEQINGDIIERSEKHASDIENMDYESVMTFYAEDLIVFGPRLSVSGQTLHLGSAGEQLRSAQQGFGGPWRYLGSILISCCWGYL